ncbi:MAG: peptide ABC transporter permease, partial [Candidatus Tectomicrobia bacterium]|nr:peptide ABC transporter permease [Candidatus Tectomicrobia bacterium]
MAHLWKEAEVEVSLWRDAWRRLRRNRLAVLGGLVIIVLSCVALLADVIAPYHYTKAHFLHAYEFPSRDFPPGTDPLGRDMLSRIIYGARISMLVGVVAQCIVVSVGVPIGAVSAYYGGKVDLAIMRFVDVMYAFPRLLFVILIMSMLGAG